MIDWFVNFVVENLRDAPFIGEQREQDLEVFAYLLLFLVAFWAVVLPVWGVFELRARLKENPRFIQERGAVQWRDFVRLWRAFWALFFVALVFFVATRVTIELHEYVEAGELRKTLILTGVLMVDVLLIIWGIDYFRDVVGAGSPIKPERRRYPRGLGFLTAAFVFVIALGWIAWALDSDIWDVLILLLAAVVLAAKWVIDVVPWMYVGIAIFAILLAFGLRRFKQWNEANPDTWPKKKDGD